MKRQRSESGQIAVILALAMVGLLAFTALAIDGGNMYLQKRNAQNAADAGAIAGTREVHRLLHIPEEQWPADINVDLHLRGVINEFIESNGVPDTNASPADVENTNTEVWYLDVDGERIGSAQVGQRFDLPSNARGIQVIASIPFDTFIAGIIGQPRAKATADAGAIYEQQTSSFFSAIYAGGTCTPHTLDLSGSYQRIVGGLHSNGNISLLGNAANPSYYSGTVEAVGEIHYQEDQMDFDCPECVPAPPNDEGPLEDFDPIFSLSAYDINAMGHRADAAVLDPAPGDQYHYYDDNHNGTAPSLIAEDGLHFSADPDGMNIPANFPDKPDGLPYLISIVTAGPIRVQASTMLVAYEPQILLFSTYGSRNCPSNETAITLAGDRFDWEGLIYAPNGHIDMSAAENSSLKGLIVGWTVSLSGSFINVEYDPRYDPPPPPRVVLVW